ncbi:MAG: S41 family peptidase [Actinomycetota bacterium]|nr:S41 family peptidase [Actinomycetota bacterium]
MQARRALAMVVLLLAAACQNETSTVGQAPISTTVPSIDLPSTTRSTSPPPSATSSTPPSPQVEISDCQAPPDEFALLCEAYQLLKGEYVDPVDDARLARGAARGLGEYRREHSLEGEQADPPVAQVTCAVPSRRFAPFCQSYAAAAGRPSSQEAELVEAAVQGMVEYGLDDTHSRYLPPELFQLLREDLSGEIEGIGAFVRATDRTDPQERSACTVLSDTCRMLVVKPIEGSPAEEAGLQAGDVVTAVEGRPVQGWTVDELISRVRGPAGSQVTLGILRGEQHLEVTITREKIELPLVEARMLEPEVGYIHLTSFTSNSPEEFHQGLEELLASGARQIIFDLQDNPGGFLGPAIQITSEFQAEGTVVIQESPGGEVDRAEVVPGGLATDPAIEVVVLVNRASASASEIVAGALQESGRATIIGERTFGKGTVQQDFALANQAVLKLTVARWFTSNHTSFEGVGIEPDVKVEVPDGAGGQLLIDRALEWLEER